MRRTTQLAQPRSTTGEVLAILDRIVRIGRGAAGRNAWTKSSELNGKRVHSSGIRTAMERPHARLRAIGVAVLVAAVLLVIGRQITAHGWYAAEGAYRA